MAPRKQQKTAVTNPTVLMDVTLDTPENVEDPRQLRIVLDKRALETARKVTDELIVARRLPLDPDNIQASDPLALMILAQDRTISGSDAAYRAGRAYEGWLDEARREAMIVAMTMYTETNRKPRPYEPEEEEVDDGTPSWMKDDIKLPSPERNLNNRYEARLKVIYDILDDAGPLFGAQFNRVLNDDLANKLRELGVGAQTDDDGFQPTAVSA